MRGQVISLKTREFVEAARAIGVVPVLSSSTFFPIPLVRCGLLDPLGSWGDFGRSLLSFLGLGVQPPTPSWGSMITEGARQFEEYPWTMIWPGLVLTVTLFAMNFVGDGVRDAIDPKTQKE